MYIFFIKGCLFLDEVKLSEVLSFQKYNRQRKVFIGLGKFTGEIDRNKLGDLAFVLLFQPSCGKWFLTIRSFLGSETSPGTILNKLVVEAIIILKSQNVHVDSVTTDGATWNQSMWKLFEISQSSSSYIHTVVTNISLWFASDFTHLIKHLKSRIIYNKTLKKKKIDITQ